MARWKTDLDAFVEEKMAFAKSLRVDRRLHHPLIAKELGATGATRKPSEYTSIQRKHSSALRCLRAGWGTRIRT